MATPVTQWTNANGTVVRVFATDEPFRFRVTQQRPWWFQRAFNMNRAIATK